jgi:DNA-binding NtrC family response regulator
MKGALMSTPKRSVLLVDDDRDLRETLADGLEAAGYRVIQAENVYTLMRELPSMNISVAILDLVLAGPSGGALVGYIKMHPHLRHIKVIMMSGVEHAESASRLWGADIFLQKPVTIAKLKETLDRVLVPTIEIKL